MKRQRMNPIFIVLEGGEGSGKSTIARILSEKLEELGYSVCLTREPGGVESAEEIREILLKDRKPGEHLNGLSEAFLFAAARSEHLDKKVIERLNMGHIVIMDRYYYSSLAYQGEGRQLGFEQIMKINDPFIKTSKPNITFYLKTTNGTRNARLAKRGTLHLNHLDRETEEFVARVEFGYEKCKQLFEEFIEIDANRTIHHVVESCMRELLSNGLIVHE